MAEDDDVLELLRGHRVENDPPSVACPPGYQADVELGSTRAYDSITLGGTSVEDAAAAFVDELGAALEAAA